MASGKSQPEAIPADLFETPVFAAVIRPHRSLTPDGFRIVMIGLGLVMLVPSGFFIAMGFWPVAGFFGLDLLGLFIAFRVSYGRGRAFEEVVLTPLALTLRRVSHRGRRQEWRFNPLWTRLSRQEDEEFGLLRLAVVSRGRQVAVAGELSPPERAHFADALGEALAEVKRGR